MSEAVSALNGASFDGFARVDDTGLRGMITLRGDLPSAAMAKAVKAAIGADIPGQRKIEFGKSGAVAWMSPDELLVITEYSSVAETMSALQAGLKDQHALIVNVSDARAVVRVSGDGSREVMAKLAPVDFSTDVFGPGDFRRSRLAQVAAAFWVNTDDSIEVICFSSVAKYVFDVLSVSAQSGGEVGYL
ncbi:sarcosine oxidase subunit gamma family protein [Shimia sp.]|uniref:sarcosine oxidase subunit gamma n=1 Tax=Shimia sp. TaxID=1954381 RepID=UPI00329A20A9